MARYPRLTYELPFPREEFDMLDRVVRATLLAQGRGKFTNTPRRVTTQAENLPLDAQETASKDGYWAWCFSTAVNPDQFDLWFHPTLELDSRFGRHTVLHELCHGHLGNHQGHNIRWREFYCQVLLHYSELVSPTPNLDVTINHVLKRYTRCAKVESYPDFNERVLGDQVRIEDKAGKEAERVHEIFTRLTKQDNPSHV